MWLPTDVDDHSEKENCVTLFNEAGLCPTPQSQMEQVYFDGTARNCGELWRRFLACTAGRSRGATPLRPKGESLWALKSEEEAARDWQSMFGHLQMKGTYPAGGFDKQEEEDTKKKETSRKWSEYFAEMAQKASARREAAQEGKDAAAPAPAGPSAPLA